MVVLALAASRRLSHIHLWIAYGVGKHFRYLAAHEIATTLGPSKCRALPFFHALSGCDLLSFFHGKGKKTAWATSKNLDAVTEAFFSLRSTAQQIKPYFELIEQFIVLLYDRTTTHTSVNQARKELFAQKGRAIDLIHIMLGTAGHNTALQHQKCPLHLFGVDEEGHWKVGCFLDRFTRSN